MAMILMINLSLVLFRFIVGSETTYDAAWHESSDNDAAHDVARQECLGETATTYYVYMLRYTLHISMCNCV